MLQAVRFGKLFSKQLLLASLIALFSFFPYGQYIFTGISFGPLETSVAYANPGGIGTDLDLWLKADAGVTGGASVSQWADQSGNGNHATQATATKQPTATAATINFNPSVTFDGLPDATNGDGLSTPAITLDQNASIFVVNTRPAQSTGAATSFRSVIASAENWQGVTDHTGYFLGHRRIDLESYANGFSDNGLLDGITGPIPTDDSPLLHSVVNTAGTLEVYNDGGSLGTVANTLSGSASHVYEIGYNPGTPGGTGDSRHFAGDIGEIVVYNQALSPTERVQVESYLALKYGITLDSSVGTYKDSAGADVYDLSTYNNDVFGIGNDTGSTLDQQISKSVNPTAIVTVSTDTDFTGANGTHASLTNGQYLVIGNNAGATTTQVTEVDAASFNIRTTREWKAENTGSVGAVNLKFDGFDDTWMLYTDADGDFSTGATSAGMLSATGEITGVTLTDGLFFTLAKPMEFPGGVGDSLSLWLKADTGVTGGATVTQWDDQSGSARDFSQTVAANQPAYNTASNLINFNPSLEYDGADVLERANTDRDEFADNSSGSVFAVGEVTDNTGDNYYFNQFGSTGNFALHLAERPAGAVLDWGGGGTEIGGVLATNTPTITSGQYTGTAGIVYRNGESLGATTITNGAVNNPRTAAIGGVGNTPATGNYNGRIAEVITFDRDVTVAEQQQIESYLALKYGITLDQTTDTNYVASNGTTDMWTNDADAYDRDIFGIGKDIDQGLDQRISKSVNTDAILTISTDTDFTSANTTHADSLTDLQFLTIANNDTADDATATQVGERDAKYFDRITREWKVDNVGGVGAVNLKFDGYDDEWTVVVDDDGDFTGGTQSELGTLSATGELNGVTLNDGDYFTLMRIAIGVEFSTAIAASTDESVADNFPVLLVNGVVDSTMMVDIGYVNHPFFTTATDGGVDFAFTNPTTITIPAGTYDGTLATAITLPAPVLNDDGLIEGDERIRFGIGNFVGGLPMGLRDADGNGAIAGANIYTITDDDAAAVILNVTDNLTTEGGTDTGEVTVVLQSQPTADVDVTLTILGADQAEGAFDAGGTLFSTTVTVPAASWNVPVPVTIFGLDEVVDDGNYIFTVVGQSAASTDANYVLADADIADVTLINQDDDISDIIVTSSDSQTSEGGDTATVTLTPSSAPTADVTVPVFISDPTEGSIVITEVVLLSGSVAPVDIIVTGLDDLLADGDVTYQIYFGDPTSTDLVYDALVDTDLAPQNIVNIDDEIDQTPVPTGPTATSTVSSATVVSGSCSLALAGGTVKFETNPTGGLDPEPQTMTLDVNGDYSGTLNWATAAIGNTYGLLVTCIDPEGNEVPPYEVTPLTISSPPSSGGGGGGSSRDIDTRDPEVDGTLITLKGEVEDNDDWEVWFSVSDTDSTPSCSNPDIKVDVSGSYDEGDKFEEEFEGKEDTKYYIKACGQRDGSSSTKSGGTESITTGEESEEEEIVEEDKTEEEILEEKIKELQEKINDLLNQDNQTGELRQLLGGGEPNVPTEFQGQVCQRYLTDYIWPNRTTNDPTEVRKLQTFLNEVYGENLPVDGIYNADDIEAVKRYQTTHRAQILSPWGLTNPTANVYRTTVTKMNLEMCGYDMDTPYFTEYLGVGDVSLESVRVQDFINLTNSPISGYPTTGLPLTTTYTQETANAVKEYQNRYRTTVLDPWGLSSGTGWWYQTTRSSANALVGTPEPQIQLDNGVSHTAF